VKSSKSWVLGTVSIVAFTIFFLVPFAFIFLIAVKDQQQAAELSFSWPTHFQLWQNLKDTISSRDYILVIAFINSTILTVASVTIMVILGAMVAYILQRRRSRLNGLINLLVLSGLIIPPAVVPTIWVLQRLHIFKTLPGLILVVATFGLAFCILLFRAFIATIPRDLDEAAMIDGAGAVRILRSVIIPQSIPAIVAVTLFHFFFAWNDFFLPLLYLAAKPELQPLSIGIQVYNALYLTQPTLIQAASLMTMAVPVIVFFLAQRAFMRTVVITGVEK